MAFSNILLLTAANVAISCEVFTSHLPNVANLMKKQTNKNRQDIEMQPPAIDSWSSVFNPNLTNCTFKETDCQDLTKSNISLLGGRHR